MFEDLKPHIMDLRKRLGISVASVIILFCCCFAFWEPIMYFIAHPAQEVMPSGFKFSFTHPAGSFIIAMKVAIFAALFLSMPIIFWQLWLFVAPGLYDNEKKYVIPFVSAASFMFLVGGAFCYFLVIPYGFKFLINFGAALFTPVLMIGDYIGFFTKLVIAFGLAFELPVITFFLAKLGLVTDQSLKDFFRYAIVLIFIFAAVLTPPDVISQIMMAIPLIFLYLLSIFIAKLTNPAKKDEDEKI